MKLFRRRQSWEFGFWDEKWFLFRKWFFSTVRRCPCGCNCGSCREGRHRGRTWGWTVPNWKLSAKRARGRGGILLPEELSYFEDLNLG